MEPGLRSDLYVQHNVGLMVLYATYKQLVAR
jgi:hypothetical protein